ncbi:hypothetical protein [uncultured Kordia sp.]|uniref:hypothetical protein n=1 Tax=uncultured Kordia sp. TaxID=507699 RepID=UPI002604E787|nr:hypothetical protein [uncultured Kordia sp.]
MKKQKIISGLQLKKLTISDLQTNQVKGGLPTTLQSTVVTITDIPLPPPSTTKDPRPMTISYSNCGNCTSW